MPESTLEKNVRMTDAAALLRGADSILIVSHLRPDGDCLGSTLGLLHGLRQIGKKVAAYNVGPTGGKWEFVPGIEQVRDTFPEWEPKWTVFVDCGAVYRVSDDFQPAGQTLNIDHHLTNAVFADFNYIDARACAVGEQIYLILKELGVEITAEIASCLFLSILTDTGGFRYPNTTAGALRLAGDLVEAGADPGPISQAVFESKSPGEFALMGKVYSNLVFEEEGAIVWAEITWAELMENGGPDSEPDGLSSEIRGVKGAEVSILFQETEEGWLRAGFRGKGAINCGAIAESLGGGGHFNASGVMIRQPSYEAARGRVLDAVRSAVREWRAREG